MKPEICYVVLPVFSDREFTAQVHTQTADLAAKLKETVEAWIAEQPKSAEVASNYSVGAAMYAALWDLSESVSPQRRNVMRQACAMTLLQNDKNTQLALAPVSSLPN